MRRGLSQGLFGGGLAALLLSVPAAAPYAQTHPVTIPPAKDLAATPAPVKPGKPTAKVTDKHPAPGHSAKVTTKPKVSTKKVATAKKPAPKPAVVSSGPVRQAAAAPPPSYTITSVRDNVTYKTTRVVPIPAPGAPAAATLVPATAAASLAAATQKPAATLTQAVSAPPPVTASAPAAVSPSAHQAAATPASSFVSAFLGRAFGIAHDGNMTALQRRALLADLFANRMDVGRIAGYTTGDELTGQTADFQHRFKTILISYLVETYYPRIELAAEPSVKVDVTSAAPQPDGTAVVWTTFTKSDWVSQTVKWHLTPVADGFKIVDIYSGGASLVQMERDTFRSVMRDGGLPQLMAKLDARTKALSTAAP